MIKLVIFDLDGVLVEARDIHYYALNRALSTIDDRYIINRDEHLSTYDGLPTKKKLEILPKEKGLSKDSYKEIWERKQERTAEIIKDSDVINFSFNKTKLEQVYTGVKFKYNYNYTTEKYALWLVIFNRS